MAFNSSISIFITPLTLKNSSVYFSPTPAYITLAFSNFRRLADLNISIYNKFFLLFGFKVSYLFKDQLYELPNRRNLDFSTNYLSKYVFFSSSSHLNFADFFSIISTFNKTSDNDFSFFRPSSKFSRGAFFIDFFYHPNTVYNTLDYFEQTMFKNFHVLNPAQFFSSNYHLNFLHLNSLKFLFFRYFIFFIFFRFSHFK